MVGVRNHLGLFYYKAYLSKALPGRGGATLQGRFQKSVQFGGPIAPNEPDGLAFEWVVAETSSQPSTLESYRELAI